jgi:phospholipid transport system substrate-binding protein
MILFRRSLIGVAFAAAALLAGPPPARADAPTTAAAQFVQSLGNRAMAQLVGKQVPEDEERARFRQLLEEAFDVPTIGKFTAGPYWRSATEQQKQEFLKLFENQVVAAYAKRFQEYSGEQFKVNGAQAADGGDVIVDSQIVRPAGGPPVHVQWRVRPEPSGLKIVDVTVEGISMSVTQRQEYASVIERGGGTFDALIEALRNQSAPVASPPASPG